MFRPADVDDTAGFMAAVRALNQSSQASVSAVVKDASSEQESHPEPSTSAVGSPTAPDFVPSSPSSLAGNHGGSQDDAWTPAAKDVLNEKRNFSPVGSPTAPEFVPSPPSSLAGNAAGSQSGFSSAGPKPSSFVGDPAAEEFVPSPKPSSLAGNPVVEDAVTGESVFSVYYRLSLTTCFAADHGFQTNVGLDSSGSKPQPVNPTAAFSKEQRVVSNVDDTAGFMAAVRALNQSRNVSAAVDITMTVSSNVEQNPDLTDVTDDNGGSTAIAWEPEQPTNLSGASPAREYFTPSPSKFDKEPLANDTAGFTAPNAGDSAQTIQPSSESPPKEPTTSSFEEPVDVDDTAAFMAAARRLRRTPASDDQSAGGAASTAQDADKSQTSWLDSLSPVKEDLSAIDVYNTAQIMTPVQAVKHAELGRPSMSPAEHFVSATSSPAVKFNGDMDDTASSHTVTVPKQEPAPNGLANASVDTAGSSFNATHADNSEPKASKEKITINVNDTAGFLAAVRALKEKNKTPSVSRTNAAPYERRPSSKSAWTSTLAIANKS